ncbi:MAG TPA: sigma-70 family RNA polymerase sigma factor [Kofleriaceae bacterium]|nr:sigma-70 family RNA polymerase sigma factor [Kofleriaceae bacterium]
MLDTEGRSAVEAQVRALCDSGDFRAAVTQGIESYGPEILGYLLAVTRSETDANDAFAMFTEDLWRGLPTFRWESSLRTWSYTLARHALHRLHRDPHRRADRRVPLSRSPEVYEVAERVRTVTSVYLRTEVKDQVAALREELDPEDQTLFILRLNRRMTWTEIAQIMAEEPGADDTVLERTAARLRKRFERAKEQLKQKVRERGIGASLDE